jgi:hypothetical protein
MYAGMIAKRQYRVSQKNHKQKSSKKILKLIDDKYCGVHLQTQHGGSFLCREYYTVEYARTAEPFLTLSASSCKRPIGENKKGPKFSGPVVDKFHCNCGLDLPHIAYTNVTYYKHLKSSLLSFRNPRAFRNVHLF